MYDPALAVADCQLVISVTDNTLGSGVLAPVGDRFDRDFTITMEVADVNELVTAVSVGAITRQVGT